MTEVAIVENPFGTPAESGGSLQKVEQHRAIAEVQAAMVVARANPRNMQHAVDRILNSCTRPTLAQGATYDYARGGTAITGPSIRLAEVIAQCWGNIQYGLRELSRDEGVSEVQAYAWDVETNTRREMVFQVQHSMKARGSIKKLSDPRDVYELVANQGARRLRACILAIIPGDVVESAVSQCETTLKAKVDTSAEAVQKMLDAFAPMGVSKEQIEVRIQRRIESVLPAQMLQLGKIYNSLKDGMSVAGDWFQPIAVAEERGRGVEGLTAAVAKPKRTPKTQPKPAKIYNMDEPAPPAEEPTPPIATESAMTEAEQASFFEGAQEKSTAEVEEDDAVARDRRNLLIAAYKSGINASDSAEVPEDYNEEEAAFWLAGANKQKMPEV